MGFSENIPLWNISYLSEHIISYMIVRYVCSVLTLNHPASVGCQVYCGDTDKASGPLFALRDKGAWRSYVTVPANRVLQTSPYLPRPSYITPGVDQVRLPDRVSLDLVRVEI